MTLLYLSTVSSDIDIINHSSFVMTLLYRLFTCSAAKKNNYTSPQKAMHWSVMAWQEVVVATSNLFSITTKGPDGPGAAFPLPAVAGPSKLLWHLQQWHPASLPLAMGLMNCSRDILSLQQLQAVCCCFEAPHHLKCINTGFKLWRLQTTFWMIWFFTLISLLFALFFLGFGVFFLFWWFGDLFVHLVYQFCFTPWDSIFINTEFFRSHTHWRPLSMPTISWVASKGAQPTGQGR